MSSIHGDTPQTPVQSSGPEAIHALGEETAAPLVETQETIHDGHTYTLPCETPVYYLSLPPPPESMGPPPPPPSASLVADLPPEPRQVAASADHQAVGSGIKQGASLLPSSMPDHQPLPSGAYYTMAPPPASSLPPPKVGPTVGLQRASAEVKPPRPSSAGAMDGPAPLYADPSPGIDVAKETASVNASQFAGAIRDLKPDQKLQLVDGNLVATQREIGFAFRQGTSEASRAAIVEILDVIHDGLSGMKPGEPLSQDMKTLIDFVETNQWAKAALKHDDPQGPENLRGHFDAVQNQLDKISPEKGIQRQIGIANALKGEKGVEHLVDLILAQSKNLETEGQRTQALQNLAMISKFINNTPWVQTTLKSKPNAAVLLNDAYRVMSTNIEARVGNLERDIMETKGVPMTLQTEQGKRKSDAMEELKGISAIARALPKEGIPPALLETTTKASNLIGTGESLTVDGLLEQAVFGSDPEFKGAFLNTYRWKIDTPTLFTTLSKRINDPEHPLTNEQSKQVYSFLKQWIADPNICRNEAHLALDFLSSHDLQPITVGDGTQDSNFSWEDLKSGAKTAANSPVEIPTRIGVKEADPKRTHEEVLNIAGLQNLMNQIEHPKNEKMLLQQVASELSNEAMQAFSLLDAHDFEKLAWTKKKDPHYQGVVNNANQVGIMVQAAILYSNDTTKAAEFMVKLAENLRQNGDFHTFGAIVMGLQGNAFNRLEVPMDPAIKKLAMEHRALIHPQKSFGMLRAELKKWEGKPHIPYTGMLNQDLNFIDEGNNFSKEGKLASGIFKQINDIYSTFFNSKNYQLPAMVPPNQSLGLAAVVNSLPNNANKALDAKSYAIRERGK